ncbi:MULTISPECIES: TauD/TfdA family dioxygenase [Kitasatospora]|uniref:TauD/TfdA family dioxygenase n=1 Tax=Kitasatospora TaxID=2063 RepID=UPI000C6FE64A|nr:TauD/TfdA family dioxygenase [Kitasatospora sp. GP30]MDH6144764.1 alpha-ketoglutarate-dependent taurine dioxygenase [Kitasatospora sp. GP30]
MLRTEGSTLGGVPADVHDNGHTAALVYDLATVEDPLEWVTAHREPLRAALRSSGFVLLRGAAGDVGAFHEVVSAVGGDLLEYTERSTPRSAVSGNIYTSTEYPADQAIPMHNENSYASRWPQLLFFSCQTPPATGGATPIADSRSVLALLPADLRARFADGVVYTRTYRDGLGLSWEEAFQTADRGAVEQYCTRHGIEFEWVEDGLRTRHRRPATARTAHTGEEVWFNQANLFHVSSLEPEVREALLGVYEEADLPRNAYLADGGSITDEDLMTIASVYDRVALALPYGQGDVLMIDNMLMAHGREPYTGDRRILVAMS